MFLWLLEGQGAAHANDTESIAIYGQGIAVFAELVAVSELETPVVQFTLDRLQDPPQAVRTGTIDVVVKGHSQWGPRSWEDYLHLKGTVQVDAADWTLLEFELGGSVERTFRSCFETPCSTSNCSPEALKIHWSRPCLRPVK